MPYAFLSLLSFFPSFFFPFIKIHRVFHSVSSSIPFYFYYCVTKQRPPQKVITVNIFTYPSIVLHVTLLYVCIIDNCYYILSVSSFISSFNNGYTMTMRKSKRYYKEHSCLEETNEKETTQICKYTFFFSNFE